jgi:anti-sigma factor RsiW
MNDPLCQRLDDYLAHDLTGAERDEFVAHLDQCAECRAAVQEADELSSRLRSACERFDLVPSDLEVSITGRINAARWQRPALAAIALAASIGFVAFWLSRDGSAPDTTPKPISPPIASAAPPVRVTFPGDKTLAVPVDFASPNVTVLLVYPNLRSEPPENPEGSVP